MLGYYCMPQVFFYGVHVLAGQVLNARDKFGPMMWAPIANNVVSILVLLLFLVVFGRGDTAGAFTSGQELLLGLGATLGIAVQAAVLVPVPQGGRLPLPARGSTSGTPASARPFRLAKWTLGFVLVTQLALVVVTRLASERHRRRSGRRPDRLLLRVRGVDPAALADHRLAGHRHAAVRVPARGGGRPGRGRRRDHADHPARRHRAAARRGRRSWCSACRSPSWSSASAQGARDAAYVGSALMALAIGLVPFTVQYVCLRAFYALEDTRTTFFLQCLIAARERRSSASPPCCCSTGRRWWPPGSAWPTPLAYLIGVLVSFRRLRRTAARPERRGAGPALRPADRRRRPGRGGGLADRLAAHRLVGIASSCWPLALVVGRLAAVADVPGHGPAAARSAR